MTGLDGGRTFKNGKPPLTKGVKRVENINANDNVGSDVASNFAVNYAFA